MNLNSFIRKWGVKLLGLGLFIFILSRTDSHELINALKQFSYPQISWLFILSLLIVLTKSIRFHSILSIYKIAIGFYHTILIYGSGIYLGTITPGRLGDFSKVLYLKHYSGCNYTKGLFVNIIDRIFDLIALLLTSIFALIWLLKIKALLTLIIIFIIIIFLLIIYRSWIINYFLKIISKLTKYDLTGYDFNKITNLKLWIPLSYTIIAYGLIYYQMIYIAQVIGFEINPFLLIGTLALGNVVSLIPISISGLGTRDAVFIAMLSKIGLSPAQAVSLSLSFFLLNNFSIMIIGFVMFLLLNPKRIHE